METGSSSIYKNMGVINPEEEQGPAESRARHRVKRLVKAILIDYLPEEIADIHANVLATGILYGGLESRLKLTEMALREALRRRGYTEDSIQHVVERVEEEIKAIGGGK